MRFPEFGSVPKFLPRVLTTLLLVSISAFAVSKKDLQNLPPHYRDWLTKEVNYIITDEEADAFTRLTSDTERDSFIKRFWDIRNPDPNSPTNRYRDEIYERIAYANQWFGHEAGTPGWMTDMGRVYITLGAPKQRQKLLSSANERPMEIWFYDNANPALPPFFYVLFYQRETGGDFRLYSPYMDGPGKLVTSYQAESGRVQAWRLIDHDLGREVARITLSLIPDEPVDTEGATSSLSSDVMLSTIKGLKDNPWTKRMLDERRRMLEDVTHRVLLSDEFLNVQLVPLRDEEGNTNLHYFLRLKRPEDFAIAENSPGKWYYSADVTVRVSTPENKLIFTQQRELTQFLTQDQLDTVKTRLFGYEGVLPLIPGKYRIEFVLTNKIKKTGFRTEKDVVIPEVSATGLRLSDIVPFDNARGDNPAAVAIRPFQIANIKFTPAVAQDLILVQGQPLQFFYQIWAKPDDYKSYPADAKLTAEYAYGRMGLRDTKTVVDDVSMRQFSPSGAMVNGKKIETTDLAPGTYRLAVTVSDPQTREKAFATLSFRIVTSSAIPPSWDIIDPMLSEDFTKGAWDYQRAQCYLSQGNTLAGAAWLERAFEKNPQDELVRANLVGSFFAKQEFKRVAAVYAKAGISANTTEQTILQIAQSFDKLGQVGKSIEVLESAINVKPQSAPLFLSLSEYYQKAGNPQKAQEMEQKGRNLARNAPQPGA